MGCSRIIFWLHTKYFVPYDGTGERRHPQLGCILKTSLPFARGITADLAGIFCRSRTSFDISFKFPIFCLFFMFLCFKLCAVWKCRAVVTQILLEYCLAGPGMSVHSKRWVATAHLDRFNRYLKYFFYTSFNLVHSDYEVD